jgi:plastocyanin
MLAASLGACGGDSSDDADAAPKAPPAKNAVTVNIADFKFKPPTVRVKAGGTVSFVNGDKAPHTAQTDSNPRTSEFDTGRLAKGDEKVVKLPEPGRFSYFCAYHRFMEGTVEVEE